MPFVHGWRSRGRELPSSDHDLTELVILLSVLSCRRAFVGADLRVAAMVGDWRLPPEVRSQCFRWYTVDQ